MLNRREFLGSTAILALPSLGGFAWNSTANAGTTDERIFFGGPIYPMEGSSPISVEAVAVRGDRIVHAGTLADAREALRSAPEMVDLGGKTMLPGFIEPHMHHALAGAMYYMVNIRADDDWHVPGVTTRRAFTHEEFMDALADAEHVLTDPTEWLIVEGYADYFHGKIGRAELERLSATRPIVMFQRSGHEAWLNGAALSALGFTAENTQSNPDIDFADGNFKETPVLLDLFPRLLGPLLKGDRWRTALQSGVAYLHQNGVTTAIDMLAIDGFSAQQTQEFRAIIDAPDVPLRTYMVAEPRKVYEEKGAEAAVEFIAGLSANDGTNLTYLPQAKAFVDGAFFAQLMQMNGGYTDGHEGVWVTPPTELAGIVDAFWKAGYAMHIHVNGDRGLESILATIEQVKSRYPGSKSKVTLHHLGYVGPGQVEKMKQLDVMASFLPYYVYALGDVYSDHGLGPDRVVRIASVGSAIRKGIVTSLHADYPMAPSSPLFNAWVAVNRVGQISGQVIGPEERISTWEAMRAVTLDAARTVGLEHEIGSISAGKKADFAILDKDPFATDAAHLKDIAVVATVMNGRTFAVAQATAPSGHVVVVGAGIGGLTAALRLRRAGLDVTLLESGDHPGGRIESQMFDGVAANLGAQWINRGVSPLVDSFLEKIPLQPLGNSDGGMALVWNGKVIDVGGADFLEALPFSDKAKADVAASIVKMKRDAAELYPGVDFATAPNWDYIYNLPMDTPLWRKLERMSVADYLAEFDPAVTTIWGTRVSAGFGGTPETISALFLVGWYRGDVFFPITILKGGNDRLTSEMAKALQAEGGKIVYGHAVTEVSDQGGRVNVVCADGSHYEADHCIMTVPAAPTRRIVRGLSPEKDAALAAIEYVPLTSIAMHVKNFPDGEKLSAAMYVNANTAAVANQTGTIAGNPREGTVILVCVTDAAKARLPAEQLLELAGGDLTLISPTFDLKRDLLGHAVKYYEVGEVHVKPGFLSTYSRLLGEPAGRIHFGGEFVSNYPTWGGAVWGGERAAKAVLEDISAKLRSDTTL